MTGRGKRAGIIALALVLSLGVAVSAGHAAQSKKVASDVEVDGFYLTLPDMTFLFTVFGDVHSNKPKCERRRSVTVYGSNDPPEEGEGEFVLGSATTDKTGDWELFLGDGTPNYTSASVARRKVTTKSGKKLICKADGAPPLVTD
jgi:hypothetical protein